MGIIGVEIFANKDWVDYLTFLMAAVAFVSNEKIEEDYQEIRKDNTISDMERKNKRILLYRSQECY